MQDRLLRQLGSAKGGAFHLMALCGFVSLCSFLCLGQVFTICIGVTEPIGLWLLFWRFCL